MTDEREAERFLRESNFFRVKAFAKCFSRYVNPDSERLGSYINLDFAYLALCYMHLVKSADARGDAAEKLRALRRRFMAHRGYFSKQGELKNGLAMLSEVMDRASDRLSRP